MNTEWVDKAACSAIDPELWFPTDGHMSRAARKVCAGCPVAIECLQYAMDNDIHDGVWGGVTERNRADMRVAANRRRAL